MERSTTQDRFECLRPPPPRHFDTALARLKIDSFEARQGAGLLLYGVLWVRVLGLGFYGVGYVGL